MEDRSATTATTAVDDTHALGRELARTLHIAIKTAQMHRLTNEASTKAIGSLLAAIMNLIVARGTFTLTIVGDLLFLDEKRIRVDRSGYGYIEMLTNEFTSRGIGSLAVLGKVEIEDLQDLLELLVQNPSGSGTTAADLNDRLRTATSCFMLGPIRDPQEFGTVRAGQISRRESCKKAFYKAVTVGRAVLKSIHMGKRVEFHQAKRVLQQMVDLMMDEEFTLLGLTTLKTHDSYTFYHSVNVCIYSLALGKRLGMNRSQLTELGVSALFHDLGKAKIPREILNKDGALSPTERDVMKKHPHLGVKELLEMGEFSSLAFRSMVSAFEHHLFYDGSPKGYPNLRGAYRPHLIGRIVAIADVFDAMITKRVYSKHPPTRDQALSYLMSQAGSQFDPVLTRLFANLLGVYPVGTALRLKSGRLAVVVAVRDEPEFCDRPVVRPITDEAGIQRPNVQYPDLDLSEQGTDGSYPDEIVEALDAEAMGIDVSQYYI
jgi:HD-GYP domain-containing protein (c-di-GMP phosphodiesterase class II)